MPNSGFVPRFLFESDIVPPCAESDPDSFFTEEAETFAKAVCSDCPLRLQCFLFALESGQHGIWGGTNESERASVRKGRGAKIQRSLGLMPVKRH